MDKQESLFDLPETDRNVAQNDEKKDLKKLTPDKTFGGLIFSGDVLLNKLEVNIVNTADFQRLRKIKQLSTTYLVYPSAIHTRFEHSLGVLKIAETIINKIKKNRHSKGDEKKITAKEEQIIRLMALLHDIGHMPFGHTIEDEFGVFHSHDRDMERWQYFLGEKSTIGKLIIDYWDKEFHERFYRLITCDKNFKDIGNDAYMYDIVSNTVCADLLDYLTRDCTHTNLKLEYHPRFLDYFYIKKITSEETGVEEKRIVIRVYKSNRKELRKDTVSELIQLLRNRYYLGERVYYHHTKIKMGALIAGAVLRAHQANSFGKIKNSKSLYQIHLMGDEELVLFLKSLSKRGKDKEKLLKIEGAKRLAEMFDNRVIYKEIAYKNKQELNIHNEFDTPYISKGQFEKARNRHAVSLFHKFIEKGSCKTRLEIEDKICEYLPDMQSGDLLIYCPNFDMAMKLARVKVSNNYHVVSELKDFNDQTIKEECKSILCKHQDLWAIRVFIHPKFIDRNHKEFKIEYDEYIKIIQNYLESYVFARDDAEEKRYGEQFWSNYINFLLSRITKEMSGDNAFEENHRKVTELSVELQSSTSSTRKFREIEKLIKSKFDLI